MSRDITIQYCGPYTIQTSDASISPQIVESVSVSIDRGELKNYEMPVAQEIKCSKCPKV